MPIYRNNYFVKRTFTKFAQRDPVYKTLNTTNPQYGLCLKTYNSDLYQNWINTEWIEGVDGINEASAVNVSDGKLSMDALNLSQKVYNCLNNRSFPSNLRNGHIKPILKPASSI